MILVQPRFKATAYHSTFLPCPQPPDASLDPPPSFPVAANFLLTLGSVAPGSGKTVWLLVLLFKVLEVIPFPSWVVWPISCQHLAPTGTSPLPTLVFPHRPARGRSREGPAGAGVAEGTSPVQLSSTLLSHTTRLAHSRCPGFAEAILCLAEKHRSPSWVLTLTPAHRRPDNSRAPAQPLSWRRKGQSSLNFVAKQDVIINMAQMGLLQTSAAG